MTDSILVALITLIGTLISVYATSKSTQSKITNELHTANEIQNVKIEHLTNEVQEIKQDLKETKADVREHNNYGKKFMELQGEVNLEMEKITVANHRIEDLEKRVTNS